MVRYLWWNWCVCILSFLSCFLFILSLSPPLFFNVVCRCVVPVLEMEEAHLHHHNAARSLMSQVGDGLVSLMLPLFPFPLFLIFFSPAGAESEEGWNDRAKGWQVWGAQQDWDSDCCTSFLILSSSYSSSPPFSSLFVSSLLFSALLWYLQTPSPAPRMSRTPGSARKGISPTVGQHTIQILEEINLLNSNQIKILLESNIVVQAELAKL